MKDLRITTGVAAALLASGLTAGCGRSQEQDNGWTADRDTAVCVDQQGKRVPDDKCPAPQQQQVAAAHHVGMSPFLWYYLGRSMSVPYYGETVRGGGYAPGAGRSYFRAPASTGMTRAAAISRGGFGSSARGFFGGRGGS